MLPYLAKQRDQMRQDHVKRFAARLWTVDFARPMMAAVTCPAHDRLRVDLDFLTRRDLAGLIWSSADQWSHPLLAYRTERDYRQVVLSFDWVAGPGIMPLDAANGGTLTIEGRDEAGVARTWYVRLWNYALGTGQAARIELDFGNLREGFGDSGEPVFTGDVDRMFLSIVPAGYGENDEPLPAVVSSFVELRNMKSVGVGSVIRIGDAFLPEHRARICSGYDDSYHQAPERLVEQWQALGYRKLVNHYVGMSHHYALKSVGAGRFEVAGGLCSAAVAWHRSLASTLKKAGYELILSLSYELFDENAPGQWAQRDAAGSRALTGWSPPSTLLSPCNTAAMQWLCGIATAFVDIVRDEGLAIHFQVGEPWWWVNGQRKPCFYDQETVSRWTDLKGASPPLIHDVRTVQEGEQTDFLDWVGERLAASTAEMREAARVAAQGTSFKSYLLFFSPQVLDKDAPELVRANMPLGWAFPEWDILQLEDYDFLTAGDESGMRRGREAVMERLHYPVELQQYLAGFVLDGADREWAWPMIAEGAREALRRDVPEVLLWAWPQIARDGFVWLSEAEGETEVESFHDVLFPLELGFEAVGGPKFETQVAVMASGHEQRNIQWAQARLSYDAGLGVRSEADLRTLLAFFRARRGQAFAFRFRDPLDWTSGSDGSVSASDQLLGLGDGLRTSFQLVKRHDVFEGGEVRRITRPVPGTVRVTIDHVESEGWSLEPGGVIRFEDPPSVGSEVRAGFAFDVPVRFATDQLSLSISGWRAGEAPSVPVVEVRE